MKKIVVLGSTGSVGRNTLDVAVHHAERFEIVGLAAGSNIDLLLEQRKVWPECLFTVGSEQSLKGFEKSGDIRKCLGAGNGAIERLIKETGPDLVVNCMSGFVGLRPTLEAIKSRIPVALANKEAIVAGGEILFAIARKNGVPIIPIDSEHVAVSQCLHGRGMEQVAGIVITASGGALRDVPFGEFDSADLSDVLKHPTWRMGAKITVDSATMINKGLEVIEAHWLFDLPYDMIDIIIHPQSIVHSMVEFKNGSIIAQLSNPDMRIPILYALSYPEHIESNIAPSRIADFPPLTFSEVDMDRYPCLGLALGAAREGGARPTALNSANEVAVKAFLDGKIAFKDIYNIIAYALDKMPAKSVDCIEDVLEADAEARAFAEAGLAKND